MFRTVLDTLPSVVEIRYHSLHRVSHNVDKYKGWNTKVLCVEEVIVPGPYKWGGVGGNRLNNLPVFNVVTFVLLN